MLLSDNEHVASRSDDADTGAKIGSANGQTSTDLCYALLYSLEEANPRALLISINPAYHALLLDHTNQSRTMSTTAARNQAVLEKLTNLFYQMRRYPNASVEENRGYIYALGPHIDNGDCERLLGAEHGELLNGIKGWRSWQLYEQ